MEDVYSERNKCVADPNNKIGNVQLPIECVEKNLHSLRAAIDDAMGVKDGSSL